MLLNESHEQCSNLIPQDIRQRHTLTKATGKRDDDVQLLENQLTAARRKVTEAKRTRSRFLSIMSHEIRTPLNGILGSLQILEDTDLDHKQKELFQLATNSAEKLKQLVINAMDISSVENGTFDLYPAPFNLSELVEDACESWRPLAENKGLSLDTSVSTNMPLELLGDSARIEQILNNFLSNALNYTDQGSIDVMLTVDELKCRGADDEVSVCLEVRDTGCGISREDQKLLFRDLSDDLCDVNERGAACLGLFICSELANRMGGSVGVFSTPDSGSTFWVQLPLQHINAFEPAVAEPDSETEIPPMLTAKGASPRVLLVEDSVTNQLIAKTFIESFGCQVDIAGDGYDALMSVQNNYYDVVLMDIAMPRMDGMEATRKIRALPTPSAQIPICAVTSYALDEDFSKFISCGMNNVITKPVQRYSLHRAIKQELLRTQESAVDSAHRANKTEIKEYQILNQLERSVGREKLPELLAQLTEDINSNLSDALAGANNREIDRLARACHSLQGLCASFGISELKKLSGRIHDCCRKGDVQKAVTITLSELESICISGLDMLETYQQTRNIKQVQR